MSIYRIINIRNLQLRPCNYQGTQITLRSAPVQHFSSTYTFANRTTIFVYGWITCSKTFLHSKPSLRSRILPAGPSTISGSQLSHRRSYYRRCSRFFRIANTAHGPLELPSVQEIHPNPYPKSIGSCRRSYIPKPHADGIVYNHFYADRAACFYLRFPTH